MRCVQCCTPKHPEFDDVNNMINEQKTTNKALTIRDANLCDAAAMSNRTSPMGSATNLSGSRTNLAAAGGGIRTSPVDQRCLQTVKWSCPVSRF